MPSTYAHFRLGGSVIAILPNDIREIVKENYKCFALGLHGPDLLFYYKPLTVNPTNSEGYAIHERLASVFFENAAKVYSARGRRAADEAYLFGFLCHFALDSEAHPIVNAQMKAKNITHTEIESAFDRYLMLRDEKDPFATDTTAHIVNDGDTRSVAAAYFGTDEKKAGKAIKSFIYYNRLMRTRNRAGRALISMSLKVSGMWENMHGMILPLSDNEIYSDGIAGLDSAYFRAITKAKELIENLKCYLEGKGELSPMLDRNFE